MKLAYYPVEKITKEILAIIGKYLDLNQYQVFFFGSRVGGRAHDRSDIDIGIEGPSEVPSVAMVNIRDEIERLPTLYKIDIVDFKNVSAGFRRVALKQIEPLTQN